MTNQSSRLIDSVIRDYIHPELKSRSFRRRATTWNRLIGQTVQVINVQSSQWNESARASFTINVGVFVPFVDAIIRGANPPPFVKEYECALRARIEQVGEGGMMLPSDEGFDRW